MKKHYVPAFDAHALAEVEKIRADFEAFERKQLNELAAKRKEAEKQVFALLGPGPLRVKNETRGTSVVTPDSVDFFGRDVSVRCRRSGSGLSQWYALDTLVVDSSDVATGSKT